MDLAPKHRIYVTAIVFWALCTFCVQGCTEETDPAQYLQNLRILAAEVTPLEADSSGPLQLRAYVHVPSTDVITEESWSLCPLTLGPYGNFQCIDTRCEFCLYHAGESDPDTAQACSSESCAGDCFKDIESGRVQKNCQEAEQTAWRPTLTVEPWSYFLTCFTELSGSASENETQNTPPNLLESDEIPEALDMAFRYTVRTDAGETREALVRVPFWFEGPPPNPNNAPVVTQVSVDGVALECGDSLPAVDEEGEVKFEIEIDETSLDTMQNSDGSNPRTEDVFTTYFCDAGRFDQVLTEGTSTESTWIARKLEDGQNKASIHIIIRDERGGHIVLGPYGIPINRK